MSAKVCDPYEIGLLAALAKRLPANHQFHELRSGSATRIAEGLARENLRSVAYREPNGRLEANPLDRPRLLDTDMVSLAGQAAEVLERAMEGAQPALAVCSASAIALVDYVRHASGEHPGWGASAARRVCNAVEQFAKTQGTGVPAVGRVVGKTEWGASSATLNALGELMPSRVLSARIEAGGFFDRALERLRYPVYGYCVIDRDGSRGPLGVVRDPKHCAQITTRLNDSRDPAINGPYRMVELRAVPAQEHPPFARDEHTLGYGIVSAECPLVQTEDGRTSGEVIYDGLAGVLEEVRLRNVDAMGDLSGTKGPWSAVELRAVPVEAQRVQEFAQPDAPDLDVASARDKVLGLRESEAAHITGTLVAVAHKLRALAIREPDGLLTTVIAPDGNSLANFKGLFGHGNHGQPQAAALAEIESAVRASVGKPIDLLMTAPDTCVASIAGVTHEGRAGEAPIPWESVRTMRVGAGDHFMGEVLGVYHFADTKGTDGRAYTAAVEMRLGHPLLRNAEISPAPVLLVTDMRRSQRRADGGLHELGGAKPGDILDVRMDESGATLHVQPVERALGAQERVVFEGAASAAEERCRAEGRAQRKAGTACRARASAGARNRGTGRDSGR